MVSPLGLGTLLRSDRGRGLYDLSNFLFLFLFEFRFPERRPPLPTHLLFEILEAPYLPLGPILEQIQVINR